jgi:hypothetical protein
METAIPTHVCCISWTSQASAGCTASRFVRAVRSSGSLASSGFCRPVPYAGRFRAYIRKYISMIRSEPATEIPLRSPCVAAVEQVEVLAPQLGRELHVGHRQRAPHRRHKPGTRNNVARRGTVAVTKRVKLVWKAKSSQPQQPAGSKT